MFFDNFYKFYNWEYFGNVFLINTHKRIHVILITPFALYYIKYKSTLMQQLACNIIACNNFYATCE
jgi:hypothetical protein